ncbi:NAD(+) diphosphatase [Demequina sediminicola]|uniref:NAD(+) diphosphatase n=1 Tax=Demequina sediminicola TaxID=1095026 RepID=UPI000782A661|nr:NAD(+) diphosphatase [Demequina sediminicola]
MTASPFLTSALLLDRAALHRDDYPLAAAEAVVVANGAIEAQGTRLARRAPGDAPAGDVRVLLGIRDDLPVVLVVPDDLEAAVGQADARNSRMVPLRTFIESAATDSDAAGDVEVARTAAGMAAWHHHNRFCASCGTETSIRHGGWIRHCDRCDRDHYPRTDPAMIVLITDAEDRILLAHGVGFSTRRFSLLAGFVEPGESLEQTVHREVREEVGIEVTDVTYVGSQPWPFPASLMTGFHARAVTTELDLDQHEIEAAQWLTRDELAAAIALGEVVPPPRGSIARAMVEHWHGKPFVTPENPDADVADARSTGAAGA